MPRLGLFAASLMLMLAATAARAEKITIAALPLVSSAPLFIGHDKGYFAAEGLEAELKLFQAAQPATVAIVSGDADFGVTAFTAGFFNLAGKGALRVIGAQSREEPGFDFSGFLVSNKAYAAGFHDLGQFAGHSLGITQKGSSFHYMIGLLAQSKGLELEKIRLVTLESIPSMIAALKSGEVDSIILPAHIVAKLTAAGDARLLGWMHQVAPYQLGGLFTSTRNATERRAMVERFVRAYQKAASEYHEAFNALDASGKRSFGAKAEALLPILEKYTKASGAEILAGAPYVDPLGRLRVRSVYDQVAFFQRHGLVDKSVDPAKFIDLSFIDVQFDIPKNQSDIPKKQ